MSIRMTISDKHCYKSVNNNAISYTRKMTMLSSNLFRIFLQKYFLYLKIQATWFSELSNAALFSCYGLQCRFDPR